MSETLDLVQALIRNACVNDGTPESGNEARSVATLVEYLGDPEEVFEPTPGRQSVLYRVPGSGQGPALMLMGHLDVVPVTPDGWSHDPFGGVVADGFLWGRGAVDMLNVTGAMAVTMRRYLAGELAPLTGDLLYLAVADEEAGGVHGAEYLAEHRWDTVAADYVLCEIAYPAMGTGDSARPTVNVGEKGPFWRRVFSSGTPAHGSQPYGTDNALVPLARAFAALADADSPVSISDEWKAFVGAGPFEAEMKAALTDPDLVDEAIDQLALSDPLLARYAHACTHMTIAPTVLKSGGKANVIPDAAEGSLDVRVLPGQDDSTFDDHFRKVLGADADRLSVQPVLNHVPTSSAPDGLLWESLADAHEALSGGRDMIPVLTPASTDARFWRAKGAIAYGAGWFDDQVDFGTFLSMFHGHDERISLTSLDQTERMLAATVAAFHRRTS